MQLNPAHYSDLCASNLRAGAPIACIAPICAHLRRDAEQALMAAGSLLPGVQWCAQACENRMAWLLMWPKPQKRNLKMFKPEMFKRMNGVAAVLLAAAGVALPAWAQSFKAGELEVTQVKAPASRPGQTNGMVRFAVKNHGAAADRLVGVRSAVAAHTELHDMKMDGEVMRMFRIDGIDVPAQSAVELGNGNKLHVMLLQLKEPLKQGEQFELMLQFEKAGELPVQVQVQDVRGGHGAKGEGDKGHDGHHHQDHAHHSGGEQAGHAKGDQGGHKQ